MAKKCGIVASFQVFYLIIKNVHKTLQHFENNNVAIIDEYVAKPC
jgi:hypothetical protein